MAISSSKEARNLEYLRSMAYTLGSAYAEEEVQQKKKFLIVCEGENTEPLYFKGFPVPTKTVVTEGGCNSKNALVDIALRLREDSENEGREVWCVFDFDIKPDEKSTQPKDFNSAILRAQRNGLKVAWSNDAFELWFVLHYQTMDSAITRQELYDVLKPIWKLNSFHNEAKTFEFCESHYGRHDGVSGANQALAIRRARKQHEDFGGDENFAKQCPCTTVYLLVEELNKNLKE